LNKNTETVDVASKYFLEEVNADKTTYMVMSLDRNARRIHNIKRDNRVSARAKDFKLLGKKLRIKILFKMKLRAD
jgi:hypothetical protein